MNGADLINLATNMLRDGVGADVRLFLLGMLGVVLVLVGASMIRSILSGGGGDSDS